MKALVAIVVNFRESFNLDSVKDTILDEIFI